MARSRQVKQNYSLPKVTTVRFLLCCAEVPRRCHRRKCSRVDGCVTESAAVCSGRCRDHPTSYNNFLLHHILGTPSQVIRHALSAGTSYDAVESRGVASTDLLLDDGLHCTQPLCTMNVVPPLPEPRNNEGILQRASVCKFVAA